MGGGRSHCPGTGQEKAGAYPLIGYAPALEMPKTPVSVALAKVLKRRGWSYVGPTTVYAFMQSAGMVNDHLLSCHRYGPCGKLQLATVKL